SGEVDPQTVEGAVQRFAAVAGANLVDLAWATSLNDGLAQSVPIAVEIRTRMRKAGDHRQWFGWWPIVNHHWPWGGRTEFRLLEEDRLSQNTPAHRFDSPEVHLYPTAVPSFDLVTGEYSPTWSLDFQFAATLTDWALREELLIRRARSVPTDDDVAQVN